MQIDINFARGLDHVKRFHGIPYAMDLLIVMTGRLLLYNIVALFIVLSNIQIDDVYDLAWINS